MFATSVFLLRTTEVSTVLFLFYVTISYDTLAIVQQVYTTLILVFLLRTTELLSNTETPTAMNLLLKESAINDLEPAINYNCAYLSNAPRTQTA